jgi:hypothetical protein
MLKMQGLETIDGVEVVYNYNLPSATAEVLANMNVLKQMGAISVETIMEKADLIANKDVEQKRLKKEEKALESKQEKMMQQNGEDGNSQVVAGKDDKKTEDKDKKAEK